MANLTDLIQQYVTGGSANSANAERDFQQVSQNVPQSQLAGGLADAFRSQDTPPFAQMLSTLFAHSDGQQRAGILSHLLGAAGGAAGSGMLGNLGSLLGGGSQVTPEQAQQVSPEAVQELARHAEKNDPSVIDKVSDFYSQHPTLVQALGAGSLAYIMSRMRNS